MAWLTGWDYRRALTISSSANAGTNYQVEVDLTMAGLNNHANADFGDIRFTTSDKTTLLSYLMISSVSGVSANFKVKVTDDLSTVSQIIYIYYGKVGAVTTGSTAVWTFYDSAAVDGRANYTKRALGGGVATFQWDAVNLRYYMTHATASTDMWEVPALTGNNYEFQMDFGGSNNLATAGICARYSTDGVYVLGSDMSNWVGGNHININRLNQAGTFIQNLAASATETLVHDVWYTLLVRVTGSSLYVLNSTGKTASATNTVIPAGTFGPYISGATSNSVWWKNIIVAKYLLSAPAVSATADEEPRPPDPPTLSLPTDGVTGIDVKPLLTWVGDAFSSFYRLQIAADNGFTTILTDRDLAAESHQIQFNLAFERTYYWRVNASNISGISGWSSTSDFTISSLPIYLESRTPTITIRGNKIV